MKKFFQLRPPRYNRAMPRPEANYKRGQFSLQYALLLITNLCMVIGCWCIADNPFAPQWAIPFCGAGILGGIYGFIALVVLPFVAE